MQVRSRVRLSQNVLPQLAATVRAAGAAEVLAAAEALAADARQRAPVDTGHMRDSTQAQSTGQLSAEVNATADYSGIVDMGGSTRSARPWFTPAAELAASTFGEKVAAAVREALLRGG